MKISASFQTFQVLGFAKTVRFQNMVILFKMFAPTHAMTSRDKETNTQVSKT